VTALAKACADCGYRFLDDSFPAAHARTALRARRRVRAVALTAGGAAALASTAVVVTGHTQDAGDASRDREGAAQAARARPDVLSSHPLSARAAERQLEARFTSPRDGDNTAARCSPLKPRPAHAIRHCRIRYPGGIERIVVVLTNPQGHELLLEP
jgi:hypothetical protein